MEIIVARRVQSLSDLPGVDGKKAKSIYDKSQIFNSEQLSATDSSTFVTGEIIGYCEVSEKKFGLGENFESNSNDGSGEKPRPYLSNLSVVEYARRSGVGSRLLNACEDVVRRWNAGHTEIVLQVEEDNPTAIQFYKRRGWEFVFADPTCRRYDTSGFFLRESRITKFAMVKRLDSNDIGGSSKGEEGTEDFTSLLLRKLRESFVTQS